MAAHRERRGVLAVTTSARSSGILQNDKLRKGFDMTAEHTTSGADATRPPLDQAAAVTRSLLGYGVLVGAFDLTVGLVQARTSDGYDPPARTRACWPTDPTVGSRSPTSS
jgi:hypothetical protein